MKKFIQLILILFFLPIVSLSQSLEIFDIDTLEYPLVKMKFISMDANQNQVINHTKDDFELIENGKKVDITEVTCVPNVDPISIVVYINLSDNDENREITEMFLESLMSSLPENGSELCIISGWGYFLLKFNEDKSEVLNKIKSHRFYARSSDNYIFNNPKTGALEVMNTAKNPRRKIILLTSWYINGDYEEVVEKARKTNTHIDCILTKLNPMQSMINLMDSTEGNIYKLDLLDKKIKTNLDNYAKTMIDSYCSISWNASKTCDSVINLKAIDKKNGIIDSNTYKVTTCREQSLSFSDSFINLGVRNINSSIDTSISVKSNYDYITINSINFEPDYNSFKILSKLPITLSKGQIAKIDFQVNVKDKDRKYTKIVLNTDFCEYKSSILIGSEEVSIKSKSLKILQPNGGEIYRSGSNAQITWSGMLDNESVNLKFSSNNGDSWKKISDTIGASEYIWRVPHLESNNCLISVDKLDSPSKPMKEADIDWSKAYGNFYNDNAVKVLEANDGGYLVLGIAEQSFSAFDYIVVTKVSESGEIVWSKNFNGSLHSNSCTIINTNDNNYLLVRQSYLGSDNIKIEKIDNYGNVLWEKIYGGSEDDIPAAAIQVADGSYLIAGSTESRDKDFTDVFGNYYSRENVFLLKIDSLGNKIWLKGYKNGDDDIANSLIESYDGNYLISGYRSDSHSEWDISLKNIDKDGNLIWSKYYKGSREERGNKIIQDFDGGFIISGFTSSVDGVFEGVKNNSTIAPLIMKVDINGNIMWIRTFSGSEAAHAYAMTKLSDGCFLVAGVFDDNVSDLNVNRKGYNEVWLVKITSDNKIEYIKNFGGSFDDDIIDMIQDKNGDYILVGETGSEDFDLEGSYLNGRSDNWIFKLRGSSSPNSDVSDTVFSIQATSNSIPISDNVIQLLHNVELEYVIVKIDLEYDSNTDIVVYDQLGHKVETVYSGTLEKGESEFTIDLKNYFSSRYYVRLITPDFSKSKFIEVLR